MRAAKALALALLVVACSRGWSPSTTPLTTTSSMSTTVSDPPTTQLSTAPSTAPTTTTTLTPATLSIPTTQTTQAPTPQPPTTQVPTTTPPTTAAPSGTFSASLEASFVALINDERGLALGTNSSLQTYARNWSLEMATSGNFGHSDIGSLLGSWVVVGENIGRGSTVEGIFGELLDSATHLANIVDVRFTNLGVGVFIDSSGTIWTTHIFAG